MASARGLLRLLHALESATERGVGTLSENVLEALEASDETAADAIAALRRATKQASMQKAMERREKMLKEMGLTRLSPTPSGVDAYGSASCSPSPSPSGGAGFLSLSATSQPRSPGSWPASPGAGGRDILTVAVSPSSVKGIEDVKDEDEEDDAALVCRVCFEGYKLRPRELLGVYCFCKRVENAPSAGGPGGRRGAGYSSVSHFNAIHFACHAAARRADVALRTPKREWEGAALRNSETLTNNLLPILAARVSSSAYAAAVESWWENVSNVGRPEAVSARLRIAIGDVAMLIGRFATGASFSADCHGGGRESNARALPFLLQLCAHELRRRDRATPAPRGSPRASPGATTSSSDSPLPALRDAAEARTCLEALARGNVKDAASSHAFPAALVLSTLVTPRDAWTAMRRDALRATIAHAAREGSACFDSAAPASAKDPEGDGEGEGEGGEEGGARDGDGATTESGGRGAFAASKPALLFVGVVDKLHELLQPAGGGGGGGGGGGASRALNIGEDIREEMEKEEEEEEEEAEEDATTSPVSAVAAEADAAATSPAMSPAKSPEAIAAATAHRVSRALRDLPRMHELANELIEFIEEAEDAEDAVEYFDIMRALAEATAEGDTADAFVDAAFANAW
eukprot:30846-Pelagococcus_subviridis.AAC.11